MNGQDRQDKRPGRFWVLLGIKTRAERLARGQAA
jgi:hypothetical protein